MKKEFFWITNISNMNVSLADLNLTVKPFISINLLDNKHYSYTKEQLIKSSQKGSIFNKRNKIFVRQVMPTENKSNILYNENGIIPSREKSVFIIKEEKFEELDVSDETFAADNADTAEIDIQPFIKKISN